MDTIDYDYSFFCMDWFSLLIKNMNSTITAYKEHISLHKENWVEESVFYRRIYSWWTYEKAINTPRTKNINRWNRKKSKIINFSPRYKKQLQNNLITKQDKNV